MTPAKKSKRELVAAWLLENTDARDVVSVIGLTALAGSVSVLWRPAGAVLVIALIALWKVR